MNLSGDEKYKMTIRVLMESLGVVVPDDIRKIFDGKPVRVVDDDEWNRIFGNNGNNKEYLKDGDNLNDQE